MGFVAEFNWALRLSKDQGLREDCVSGDVCDFEKDGSRVYPAGMPIDLVDDGWEAVAKVLVLEFTNFAGTTKGRYKVLKVYSGNEKEALTAYWRENAAIIAAANH